MARQLFSIFALIALLPAWALGQASDTKIYLLNVAKGQKPTDTGTDATKLSLEGQADLGKALKVVLVDSFGDLKTRVADWTAYKTLAVNIVNSQSATVQVGFNIRHKGTKNYATRVDVPFTLKPGLNEIRLDVAGLTNTNGSTPDLANVERWYIATDKKTVTLYFSDIWFEGTPVPVSKTGSDPARLERMKNAKMPKIEKVIEFNTPEADAICSALEVFPPNNPWNKSSRIGPCMPIRAISSKRSVRTSRSATTRTWASF